MIVAGVNSDRPKALDLLPLELHPWYLCIYHNTPGTGEQKDAVAWKRSIEEEPPESLKAEGLAMCEQHGWRVKCQWAIDAQRSKQQTEVDAGGRPRRSTRTPSSSVAPEPVPAKTPPKRVARHKVLIGQVVSVGGCHLRVLEAFKKDGPAVRAQRRMASKGRQAVYASYHGYWIVGEKTPDPTDAEARRDAYQTPEYYLT